MCIELATFLFLYLVSDTEVGPYIIPEDLPPGIVHNINIYGDTLYQDDEGRPYVFRRGADYKIYNPVIYDQTKPFRIRWNPRGMTIDNVSYAQVVSTLPARYVPETSVGTNEYTIMTLANLNGGYYFLNRYARPEDAEYNDLGKWPPRERIKDLFYNYYGVKNLEEEMLFRTSTRGRHVENSELFGDQEVINVLTTQIKLSRVAEFEIYFSRIREDRQRWSSGRFGLNWAGKLDVDMDGDIDEADISQVLDWYRDGNILADWNTDNVVNVSDLQSYASDVREYAPDFANLVSADATGEDLPSPSGLGTVANGCSLVIH